MYKKIPSLLTAFCVCSSMMMAGGDIAPVEEVAEVAPVVLTDDSGFYLGLGVSAMSLSNDNNSEEFTSTGIMLQAGYQINEYFAIEGRYTKDVSNLDYDHGNDTASAIYDGDYPGDFSNIAIYVKPMYSIDDFTMYALLGYGEVSIGPLPHPSQAGSVDRAEDGFQWGLGGSYAFGENISVFVDYVKLYDDKGFDYRAKLDNIDANLWTIGLTYKF